ncbi:TPA: dATP/dGTP pyrophosphohydrolase domain-containing protein [Klebsiella pneumoniae]
MSEFSRETLLNIIETDHVQCGDASALARIALAAMDSEPVALQPELAKVIYHFRDWNEGFPVERFKADYVISWMLANYPPMQPAKDREQVRREHAEWSQATFGNVGPVGPLKHLSKEALEAAAEPGDLSEWADMQFLLWDAQRRAGITDEQITQAMIEKLAVNKQRKWPEPKDGEPRLHIKEQPAPVVPDEKDKTVDADDHPLLWSFNEGWNACRAAMLAAANCSIQMISDKWIPVSERLPESNGMYFGWDGKRVLEVYCFFGGFSANQFIHGEITHWMPLPAAPQEVK